jgi:hypothetical protein
MRSARYDLNYTLLHFGNEGGGFALAEEAAFDRFVAGGQANVERNRESNRFLAGK